MPDPSQAGIDAYPLPLEHGDFSSGGLNQSSGIRPESDLHSGRGNHRLARRTYFRGEACRGDRPPDRDLEAGLIGAKKMACLITLSWNPLVEWLRRFGSLAGLRDAPHPIQRGNNER